MGNAVGDELWRLGEGKVSGAAAVIGIGVVRSFAADPTWCPELRVPWDRAPVWHRGKRWGGPCLWLSLRPHRQVRAPHLGRPLLASLESPCSGPRLTPCRRVFAPEHAWGWGAVPPFLLVRGGLGAQAGWDRPSADCPWAWRWRLPAEAVPKGRTQAAPPVCKCWLGPRWGLLGT